MCCSSGWPIPVERVRVPAIEEAITRDAIPLGVEPWLAADQNAPADVAGTLALRSNGHCVFFEAGRSGCAIHDIKPSACRHFPYVCLIDPRGVHVTLSHYCPTAVALLFEHRGPIAIVEGRSPIAEGHALEGLDARESLPPTFAKATAGRPTFAKASTYAKASVDKTAGRPAFDRPVEGTPSRTKPRLMSFGEFTAWERELVLRARIDELQSDDVPLFEHARAAVPPPWTWPAAPENVESIWWSLVAPAWPHFDDVLARYAAAKVFASWSAYLGDGVEAVARTARMAAAVLRIECARQCALFSRPLDRELMTEAIRQTDLLLVHLADQSRLIFSTDRPPD
jgi:Fe-S-cluster containining protein